MKRKHLSRMTGMLCACVLSLSPLSGLPLTGNATEPLTDEDYRTAEIFLCGLNDIRAEYGLPELVIAPILMEASNIRSEELSINYGHIRPDGREDETIADDLSIKWSVIGENIGAGSPDPVWVLHKWMESDEHRATLLGDSYTHIGVTCHYAPDTTFKYYWVMSTIGDYLGGSPVILDGQYIPERALGDANGTKQIDASDAAAILQYSADISAGLTHNIVPDFRTAADVNEDGVINSVDANIILTYAASAGSGSTKNLQDFCWK